MTDAETSPERVAAQRASLEAEEKRVALRLAKLTDGRVLFKWFHRTGAEGQKIKLSSENPNYAPMEFTKEDFQFIYPAWEVKRLLRR